jgi:nucleoside-diphosphate-sugar epimerase
VPPQKVVVTGALGVVGRAALERFAARGGLAVVGVSRRRPDAGLVESLRAAPGPVEWAQCDLRDALATRCALAPHRDATHLVFAALHELPELAHGWHSQEHVEVNTAMLANTLSALGGSPLHHVSLLQGTKAYGAHTGRPMRVPARERDERRDHPNFYFAQQDLLEARAERDGFAWTALRPQIVLGVAVGSAMNPIATLGTYAVLMRELGRPLSHPGHAGLLSECCDARLVAAAIEWSWREPRAHRLAFNLANGDVVVWRTLFARLAEFFGMELGDGAAEPARLAESMPAHADLWRRIAAREHLVVPELDALIGLSWQYADMLWAAPYPAPTPALVSTIRARRLGFGDCIDSEDCAIDHLEAMRRARYLPRH